MGLMAVLCGEGETLLKLAPTDSIRNNCAATIGIQSPATDANVLKAASPPKIISACGAYKQAHEGLARTIHCYRASKSASPFGCTKQGTQWG